jgi:hypothetical protein
MFLLKEIGLIKDTKISEDKKREIFQIKNYKRNNIFSVN